MRYSNVRDFEANLLKTTLNDIETKPKLQKVEKEELNGLIGDDARHDIRVGREWRQEQNAFFDIRLTNTNPRSQKYLPINAILKKRRKTRKRKKESL